MKTSTLLSIGAAGLAAWALFALWQRMAPASVPSLGLGVPTVRAPAPGVVDIIGGQSWGAAGADLAGGFALPDPWGLP